MSSHWHRAIAELSAKGDAARAAAQRVDDAPSTERTTAVAISYAAETDYLRSAGMLLRAHLSDRRPPRRLPVALIWPYFRDAWKARTVDRLGGVWRAIPRDAALEKMRSAPTDPLLTAVLEQAEALQASLHGERQVDRLYESFIPERTGHAVADLVGGGAGRRPRFPVSPTRVTRSTVPSPRAAERASRPVVRLSSPGCRATGSRCTPEPLPSGTQSLHSSSSTGPQASHRSRGGCAAPGAGWDASGSWCQTGRSGRRS